VDVVQDGVLYTEDAERLVLAGVRWPRQEDRRARAEAYLMEMVSDKIVFYEVVGADRLGRLEAQVWVGDVHVNGALEGQGYAG
jgi:hypothetical protein